MVGYTYHISNDPHRIRERTQIDKNSFVPLVDHVQGLISILISCLISIYVATGIVLLLLSFCVSFIWSSLLVSSGKTKQPSEKNVEELTNNTSSAGLNKTTTLQKNVSHSKGSWTAVAVLNSRSLFSNGLGGPDDLSLEMMECITMSLSKRKQLFGLSTLLNWFRILVRYNFVVTKRIYADQLNSLFLPNFKAAINTYLQARTCFLDDAVEEFVRRYGNDSTRNRNDKRQNNCANVVILGAGYDSRCYRTNLNLVERGINTFEVDAAGTQRDKLDVLNQCNIVHDNTTFVTCDFEHEDWMECLLKVGQMDDSLPTMFVWEGVTQYLPKEVVESTLQKVSSSKCPPGTCIAFDYFGPWALKRNIRSFFSKSGEAFLFAVDPIGAEALIQQQTNLKILDHIHDVNMVSNLYLPHRYNGKHVGFLGDGFGGFIVAGKKEINSK